MAASPRQTAAKRVVQQRKEKQVDAALEDLEITTAEEWAAEYEGSKLKLPSGKVCLARNPGLAVFIEKGLIPNSLMSIVMAAFEKGEQAKPQDLREVGADPQKLKDLFELVNAVLCECVIQPHVQMPPEDKGDRKPGVLYADIVDMDDKMFIFQWAVGGTKDVESFRAEQATAMERLRSGAGVAGSPGGSA